MTTPATAEADAMHVLLVLRADQLEGCTENSEEARELPMIAEAIEAYDCRCWPDGKVRGRKGRGGRCKFAAERDQAKPARLRHARSGLQLPAC